MILSFTFVFHYQKPNPGKLVVPTYSLWPHWPTSCPTIDLNIRLFRTTEQPLSLTAPIAEMGRVPSFAANESGHSAAYSLNVGNLRDTGHSAEATPPAAMAEQPSLNRSQYPSARSHRTVIGFADTNGRNGSITLSIPAALCLAPLSNRRIG